MAQQPNFNKLVLLRGFANYFDRKIFYYSSLADYIAKSNAYYEQDDINFNPNDGVETTVDLSSLDDNLDQATDAELFSYCLVLDSTNDIVSRWWIMDIVRQTNGIYRFTLKRDVVGECVANDIFMSQGKIYVEKGYLPDSDPMIVNDEGMRFNQIKTSDRLLFSSVEETEDERNAVGYVVGYFKNDAPSVTATVSDLQIPDNYVTLTEISTATGIPESTLISMLTGIAPVVIGNFNLTLGSYGTLLAHTRADIYIETGLTGNDWFVGMLTPSPVVAWEHAVVQILGDALTFYLASVDFFTKMTNQLYANRSSIKAAIQTVVQNDTPTEVVITKEQWASLQGFEGSTLYYGGQYYKGISFTIGDEKNHTEVVISKGENTFFDNIVSNTISNASLVHPEMTYNNLDGWQIYLNYKVRDIGINIGEPQSTIGFSATITTAHNTLKDAPYSMFVIPYGRIDRCVYDHGIPPVIADGAAPNKTIVLALATELGRQLGVGENGNLIDLQLLPYMPQEKEFMLFSNSTNAIWMKGKTEGKDYVKIKNAANDSCGAIFFPTISNFSFSIRYPIGLTHSMKIDSQCCFYRLCSPNYNGVFEFNLAKDGGTVYNFLIDCTLKPYNPFIRVSPEFSFLYGTNFKDGRGLICGGDFSLPQISDPWINYQLNNKNFASIFSREIENLDFTQKQEALKEKFTLGAGIVGGTAGGAAAGAKIGGGYGAIAGAAIGLGAGSAGAYIDSRLNSERRAETKDFAIDRFNLSLGNIQAMPNSLAKSSAYNITSKIFPFLEFYTCTDREIRALKDKITYDGMSVGRIGTISEFMGGNDNLHYFKGQVIRAEGIDEDNHFLAVLYEEIAKGVYI